MARTTNATDETTSVYDSGVVHDSTSDVPDEADTAARAEAGSIDGKRVRAIPYQNGSSVIVERADFAAHDIDQDTVKWNWLVDHFTVKVGTGHNQISEKAADFLTKAYPETFEYMGS